MRVDACLLFWCCLSLLAACSSDEGGGGGGNQPFAPPPNGVPMAEKAACEAITAAEDGVRNALGCGPITRPACPDYLRKGNEACLQWDQGTVLGCVEYIQKLESCDALKSYQCVTQPLPGTAPAGCPAPVDAGSDAPADTGTDAPLDAGADAPPADATIDGAAESGTDAALDAAQD